MAGYGWDCLEDFGVVTPDVVVMSRDTEKMDYLKAGYWRGYGVPVVFIGKPSDRRHLARAVGMYAVDDVKAFAAWLATNPPYLTLKPTRANGDLAPSRAAAVAEIGREP